MAERKVLRGWSLIEFKEMFEKVLRPVFQAADGTRFAKLAFQRSNGSYCFVGFSENLGEISNAEIVAKKADLRVVQLEVDPEVATRRAAAGVQVETYKLCKRGDFREWEEVAI